MKKIYTLFLIASIATNLSSQNINKREHQSYSKRFFNNSLQSPVNKKSHSPSRVASELLDSTYFFTWDTTTTAWIPYDKHLYAYDGANNKTTDLYELWSVSSYFIQQQDTYTYDINNNMTNDIIQTWNGLSWDNYSQIYNAYDAGNNLINVTDLSWNSTSWDSAYKYTYTYNANNQRTFEMGQYWSGNYDYRDYYTYDANNNLIGILEQQWDATNSVWNNAYQFLYTYDVNNDRVANLYQNWGGSNWGSYQKGSTIYNLDHNVTIDSTELWGGIGWYDDWQKYYTYDINTNLTLYSYQDVNLAIFHVNYTYDSYNERITEVNQAWNSFAGEWLNSDSIHYFYGDITTKIKEDKFDNNSISIAPNPFTSQVVISFTQEQKNSSVIVTDLLGNEVIKPIVVNNNSKSITIDKGDLKAGIYFIQVTDTNKNRTNKKVVIQ